MRKVLFILFCAYSLMGFSQTLRYDKPSQDGTRIFGTYYYYFRSKFVDEHPMGFSLNAYTENKELKCFYLGLKVSSLYNFKLPNDGLLMIRCSDGTVIECKQLRESYLTDDVFAFYRYIGNVYYVTGLYSINTEDIIRICDKGIIKIRVETENELIDKEFSQKRAKDIAIAFSEAFQTIRDGLIHPRDIRSGF